MPLLLPVWQATAWASWAFAVSAAVSWALMASPVALRLLDRPNARSLHERATPRLGGVGIVASIALVCGVGPTALPGAVWTAFFCVALVSLLDDARGLSALIRLFVHLAAAGLAVQSLLPAAPWPVLAAAALATAWGMNLYNFMDGSDGLAGGQAVFGFGALALAAWWTDNLSLTVAALAAAGAAGGFLVFNLPPARVFMGDAGAVSLGFWAAALGVAGVAGGVWALWFPILAFLPFILDATATLLDRLCRLQPVLQPHRDHAYQRLNLGGLGHRRTAGLYYSLMVVSAAVALMFQRYHSGRWFAMIWTGVLIALYIIVSRLHRTSATHRR